MPPKKDDKKKGAPPAGTSILTISEDELLEAESLPALSCLIFSTLFSFKSTRNHLRLQSHLRRLYQPLSPDDPSYQEDISLKYRTVDMR